jgi:hypothetical protein
MAHISSTGRLGRALRGSAGALAILGMGFALAAPANAEKVGIAAAVNPDAFSSLSGSPQSQLSIGKSIFFNERINTTTSGLVQVLLADGSTFTVGPGSDLVIDKFVYDPRKKSGEVVATFSKGVMRFVGGKISKNEGGVTVNTPSGALAIRGGMFQGKIGGGGSLFSFLYGNEMTLTASNGKQFTVYEPGYTLDLNGGVPNVRPTTAQDTNAFMAALTNSNKGGIGNQTNPGTPNNIEQVTQLQNDTTEMVSDANTIIVQTEIEKQLNQPPPPTNNNTPPPDDGTVTPPPPDVTQTFTGYASGTYVQTDHYGGQGNLNSHLNDNVGPQEFGRVSNENPEDFSIVFNQTKQTIESSMKLASSNGGGATLGFGGIGLSTAPGNAFGLGANPNTTIIETDNGPAVPTSLSGGMIAPGTLLCNNCDFIKWGSWNAETTFPDTHNGTPVSSQVAATGFWVAGDIPTMSDLPTQGVATYNGTTVGSISRRVDSVWNAYPAAGKLGMAWDFGSRSGLMAITNFKATDGYNRPPALNAIGAMSIPGQLDADAPNKFSGRLIGSVGLLSPVTGSATGSFVRNGGDATAGIIGNWNAGNNKYRAEGVFGAGKTGSYGIPTHALAND